MAKRSNNERLIGAALMVGVLAGLLWLERRRPLRPSVDPGAARIVRNVAMGAITGAALAALERPITRRVAQLVDARAWGVVPRLPLSGAMKTMVAVVLMDYTLYWWHVLLHRVPLLWSCHKPHHIDRDLDTTTALRFHFAEFLASIPWRCAQMVLIGVGPQALSVWQRLTAISVLFHHSNLRLPRPFERWLNRVMVTPRMHATHHSIETNERNSNFSSGLTVWDHLHGTARIEIERDAVTIGVSPDKEHDVSLAAMLALPLRAADGKADDRPA